MIEEHKESGEASDPEREGDLVVQELFFESYAEPEPGALANEPVVAETPEQKSIVRRVAKSAMLGLLMLGSLLFAGLTMARGGLRRRPSMLESLRRRFAY